MRRDPDCDLSLIIPFTDDEDRVGAMIRRAALHLDALGLRHEILAVDEGSSDNSTALVGLLRESTPALSLLAAPARVGFAAGARVARGRVLWLWDAGHAGAPLGPLSWARRCLESERCHLALVPGRFVLCRRTAAWRAVESARGRGRAYERHLVAQARRRRLTVESPPAAPPPPGLLRRLLVLRRA